MPSRLKALSLAASLALCLILPARAATPDAKQVVDSYYATLLDVMKNGKQLGFKGRYQAIKPAVDKSFDIAAMTQSTVGSYWDSMTPEQRKDLIEAFEAFTVANYANHFGSYGGEKLETYGAEETPRKDILVASAIIKSSGDKVKINYLLRDSDGAYKIIDVFVDGSISELATRRSEFTSVIRRDGVDALIKLIHQKADDLATG